MEPGSYHLICLLKLDSKILSKIIANRLALIMPILIHPSQAGFTLRHSATSNIRKVLTVLEHARAKPSSYLAIITLDAEKAFDSISFHWLRLVLQNFSFSGSFLHLISTMYSAPSANVIAAGHISNQFHFTKEQYRGAPCPQFCLTFKPLSRYLLLYSRIHRVMVGHHELHTALFSDNILIFTSNPHAPHSEDIHPV